MSPLRHRARRGAVRPPATLPLPSTRLARKRVHAVEPLEPRRLLATFTVTSPGDNVDPADGVLTLREAILAANASNDADTINFAIPGNGPHVISTTGLPTITHPVTVNGLSQNGARANTLPEGNNSVIKIQLRRAGPDRTGDGLHLGPGADGSAISLVSVTGFENAILVEADDVKISGAFIGLDPAGLLPSGPIVFELNTNGIVVRSGSGVDIGGADEASRTVVSGNVGTGILLDEGSVGARVRGVYAGTDPAGKADRTNRVGILALGRGHELGGLGVNNRLLISGNVTGVQIGEPGKLADRISLKGSLIGAGIDYTDPGNNEGIRVRGGTRISIGGIDDPYEGNLITDNVGPGLVIEPDALDDVAYRLNPIFGNIQPIEVPAGGPVPTLTSATTSPAGTAVTGNVTNASPGAPLAVDVFGSHEPGEGEVFLETIRAVATAGGTAAFNATVLASGMRYVTAYVTDLITGGTSALSNAVENARPPVLTVTNTSGSQTVAGSYPFALKQAATTPGPEVIAFAIPGLTAAAQIAAVLISGPPPQVVEMKDVIVDGTTQGGGGLVPRVYIVGSGADLHFVTSGVTIFGLGFANARGIDLEGDPFGGDGFNRISRNFLGVSPQGQPVGIPPLDTRAMLRIFGDRNRIDHNLIHNGRRFPGIWGFGASFNVFEANRIGVNLEGRDLADNGYGIQFANDGVSGPSNGNRIFGNTIANSRESAISILVGEGNDIFDNTLYRNGAQGIDLGGDGRTENDPLDADAGPNLFQNYPEFLGGVFVGSTRVVGTLDSAPNTVYRLDVYAARSKAASDADEGYTYLGAATVTTDASGHVDFNVTVLGTARPGDLVLGTATDPNGNTSEFSPAVAVSTPPTVAARHVFYNNSSLDAGAAGDDGAIDPNKSALLPGQAATNANITNYSRGINGVMVDVPRLPPEQTPGPDDFVLHAGNGASWSQVPAPTVSVRRGAGASGSDRVTLILPDGAVRNTWLRVTVLASERTGLVAPDVFYFGNLAGDTGGGGTIAVNTRDLARVRANLGKTAAAALSASDFNRDARVNAADLLIARANFGRSLPPLTAAPAAPAAPGVAPAAGPSARSAPRPIRRGVLDDVAHAVA